MYWHGNPLKWDEFLDLPLIDRLFANLELDDLIEQSNETGGGQPSDDR